MAATVLLSDNRPHHGHLAPTNGSSYVGRTANRFQPASYQSKFLAIILVRAILAPSPPPQLVARPVAAAADAAGVAAAAAAVAAAVASAVAVGAAAGGAAAGGAAHEALMTLAPVPAHALAAAAAAAAAAALDRT